MNTPPLVPFETDNTRAYLLLLRIEIALRELVRQAYQGEFGDKWRRRIPGDLLRKIRAAESSDAAKRQFGFRRLGPLYYLTFGELLTLLQQNTCTSALTPLGGTSFVAQIENLSAVRNAISHARAVSCASLTATEALYAQLESALSPETLAAMLASPDVGLDPDDVRSRCAAWLGRLPPQVRQLRTPLDSMPDHQNAKNQYWWGDIRLAGFDTASVDQIVELVHGYNALAVGVGSAGVRQRFVTCNNLREKLDLAIHTLARAGDDRARN